MNNNETTDNPVINYTDKLHRWRMAFFGMVILIAGAVIGGASMMILAPDKLMKPPRGPEFGSERMIPPLRRDLGLSPEQEEKIKPILDKHMQKLHDIRMEARSEIEEALTQMNKSISDILTEEQRQIWQRGLDRLEREFHRGGSHRGGGGPRGPGGFRGGQQERFRGGQPERYRGVPPRRPPRGPNSPRDDMDRGTIYNRPGRPARERSSEQ